MASLFQRNPRLTLLVLILIAASGLSALELLPRLEDPRLTLRFAFVLTRYPGADAERVESLVTRRLEDEIREIPEVKLIASTSRAGISVIRLELGDEVVNVDEVWSRMRDRLGDAVPFLPDGAFEPSLELDEVETYTHLDALVWEGEGEAPAGILRRLALELEEELRSLSGTTETSVVGEVTEEITVELEAHRLAGRGLDPGELARRIAGADAKVPAGTLRGDFNLAFEVAGELDTLDRVRALPVRSEADGKTLRLGDIAQVRRGVVTPRREFTLIDGKEGVVVATRMAPDIRVDRWADTVKERLEEFSSRLPANVALQTIFDQSRYTTARLEDLLGKLLVGALLVELVVLLMMGWRSALLVGTALPLATLMVLSVMHWSGVPLHQMSVTGLIIALGLLIDSAIVMVNEVQHRLRHHGTPAAAMREAVRHLAVPLLGSTLTTVFALMPLVLMPGPAGEFIGTLGLSVIFALGASLFLALTIIPAFSAWVASRAKGPVKRSWWSDGISIPPLTRAGESVMRFLFRRPLIAVAFPLLFPLFGFLRAGELEEQFFPGAERDQFQVQLTLPAQTSIELTKKTALEARALLLKHPEVKNVHWFVGGSAPLFYYNMLAGQDDSPHFAQAMVQLHDASRTTEVIHEVQRELDHAFPAAQVVALQFEQGPPFEAPVEMRIYGPDLDVLRSLGDRYRALLASCSRVTHTRATLGEARPRLLVDLDEESARASGIDNRGLASELQFWLDGGAAGTILEATEELPVRVRLQDSERGSLPSIRALDLVARGEDGGVLPLQGLADIRLVPEWATIQRRDARRCNTVQGFISAGTLPAATLHDFQKAIDREGLAPPVGYRLEVGGESQERDQAVGQLMAKVGLLVLLMAMTLVLSFNSFRHAAIIGVVGACSVGLSLGALWTFDFPFGFMAIVGTMGLIGIAVNDAIVVLAGLRGDPEARRGDPVATARVVLHETRHVLATTITTMAGFAPLILGGGAFWPPLAVVIAGGLGGATMLALTLVPALHLLVAKTKRERPSPAAG